MATELEQAKAASKAALVGLLAGTVSYAELQAINAKYNALVDAQVAEANKISQSGSNPMTVTRETVMNNPNLSAQQLANKTIVDYWSSQSEPYGRVMSAINDGTAKFAQREVDGGEYGSYTQMVLTTDPKNPAWNNSLVLTPTGQPNVYSFSAYNQVAAGNISGVLVGNPETGFVAPVLNAATQFAYTPGSPGGVIRNIVSGITSAASSLGPLGAVALAFATQGLSAELGAALGLEGAAATIAGNTILQTTLNGGDVGKALTNSLITYAGASAGGLASQFAQGGELGDFLKANPQYAATIANTATRAALTGQSLEDAVKAATISVGTDAALNKIDGFSKLDPSVQSTIRNTVSAELQGKDVNLPNLLTNAAVSGLTSYALSQNDDFKKLDPKYQSLIATEVSAGLRGKPLDQAAISWAINQGNQAIKDAVSPVKQDEAVINQLLDQKATTDPRADEVTAGMQQLIDAITNPQTTVSYPGTQVADAGKAGDPGSGTYFDSQGRLVVSDTSPSTTLEEILAGPSAESGSMGTASDLPGSTTAPTAEDLDQQAAAKAEADRQAAAQAAAKAESDRLEAQEQARVQAVADAQAITRGFPSAAIETKYGGSQEAYKAALAQEAVNAGFPSLAVSKMYNGNLNAYAQDMADIRAAQALEKAQMEADAKAEAEEVARRAEADRQAAAQAEAEAKKQADAKAAEEARVAAQQEAERVAAAQKAAQEEADRQAAAQKAAEEARAAAQAEADRQAAIAKEHADAEERAKAQELQRLAQEEADKQAQIAEAARQAQAQAEAERQPTPEPTPEPDVVKQLEDAGLTQEQPTPEPEPVYTEAPVGSQEEPAPEQPVPEPTPEPTYTEAPVGNLEQPVPEPIAVDDGTTTTIEDLIKQITEPTPTPTPTPEPEPVYTEAPVGSQEEAATEQPAPNTGVVIDHDPETNVATVVDNSGNITTVSTDTAPSVGDVIELPVAPTPAPEPAPTPAPVPVPEPVPEPVATDDGTTTGVEDLIKQITEPTPAPEPTYTEAPVGNLEQPEPVPEPVATDDGTTTDIEDLIKQITESAPEPPPEANPTEAPVGSQEEPAPAPAPEPVATDDGTTTTIEDLIKQITEPTPEPPPEAPVGSQEEPNPEPEAPEGGTLPETVVTASPIEDDEPSDDGTTGGIQDLIDSITGGSLGDNSDLPAIDTGGSLGDESDLPPSATEEVSQCAPGFHWDEDLQICVADTDEPKPSTDCPEGYVYNVATQTCEPITTEQPPVVNPPVVNPPVVNPPVVNPPTKQPAQQSSGLNLAALLALMGSGDQQEQPAQPAGADISGMVDIEELLANPLQTDYRKLANKPKMAEGGSVDALLALLNQKG